MTEDMQKVANGLVCICKKHGKPYCYVAQKNLQLLLKKYEDWNRSERTVRRRLKDLEEQGLIRVVHRNWSEVDGVKKFKSNLYFLKGKLFQWYEKIERTARKVFSFFRRPSLANYSSQNPRRDFKEGCETVEILWKTAIKGGASPLLGSVLS